MKSTTFKILLGILFFAQLAMPELKAQYFVNQVWGSGETAPRIFRSTVAQEYFMTSRQGTGTFISKINNAGAITATRQLTFPGNDKVTIVDMIVDGYGELAGVARGATNNYIFRYNFGNSTFSWVNAYATNYKFENIHLLSQNRYAVTGELPGINFHLGNIFLFDINLTTGNVLTFQKEAFAGEFYSAYDPSTGVGIYGAGRYETSFLQFSPSLFRFNHGTGNNLYNNTYIQNSGVTRIYPVAPVIDNFDVVMLCSGDTGPTYYSYGTGPTDVWLVKTNVSGALYWTKKITIPGYPMLEAKKIIKAANNGGYYLLINAHNGQYTNTFFVVKTDQSGNLLWANNYGPAGQNMVWSGVEAFTPGELLLTATTDYNFPGGESILLVKLDQNGTTGFSCGYIQSATVNIAPVPNAIQNWPPANTNVSYPVNAVQPTSATVLANQQWACQGNNGGGGILPCNTLTGSLGMGVLSFWPFGNGTLADLSGFGNNLSIGGGTPAVAPDRNSSPQPCAYGFVSPIDYLEIPAANSTFLDNITNGMFSISLWYKPIGPRALNDYELLIGRGNTGLRCPDTWGEWSIGLYDCRRAVAGVNMWSHWEPLSSAGCAAQLTAITAAGWHHLVFVHNNSVQNYLYVDGVQYNNSSSPCGWMSGNVGGLLLGTRLTGSLDDIIIYNRSLSNVEVQALYNLNPSCCDGVTSSNKPTTIENSAIQDKAIKLYPNPADEVLTISGKDVIRKAIIHNSTGAVVNTYELNKLQADIDIRHLSQGVYFIKLTTDKEETVEKLIKR
jgi:hypothetical protein